MNQPDANTERRLTAFSIGVCVSVVGFAIWLRAPLLSESFWLDELHTAWIVDGDWSELNARCRIGNQSPLYFVGLKFWSGLAGAAEISLRAPSFLAGVALVVSIICVVRRTTNSWILTIAAALLASLDRRFIFYATEARPYAVLQLVAFWHVVATFQLANDPRKDVSTRWPVRAAWIIGAALLLHLHYTSALFIAAEVFWLFTVLLKRRSLAAVWGARVADLAIVALLATPALPHVLQIAERRQLWDRMGSSGYLIDVFRVLDAHWYLGSASIVAVLALFFAPTGRDRDAGEVERDRSLVSLWLTAALLPAILAWISAQNRWAPLFYSRYLISSASATIVGALSLLGLLRPLPRALGAAAIIAVLLSVTPQPQRFLYWGMAINDRQENWRDANAFALEQAKRLSAPIVVHSALLESPLYFERIDEPFIREYLCFPLHANYPRGRAAPYDVYPLVDYRKAAPIRDAAIVDIRATQDVVLVLRGKREHAELLVERVKSQLSREGKWLSVEWGPDFGLVHVVVIEIHQARR